MKFFHLFGRCHTKWICGAALFMALCVPAQADSFDRQTSTFVSGFGTAAYLIGGVLAPLKEDGKEGKEHALRAADALIVSGVTSELLERVTNEMRPDGTDRHSLPSTHATAAFAVATCESQFHPRQAVWWFTGATLIAASRVDLHRHYVHDVVIGAALGYGLARLELSRPHGLLLSPWIGRDGGGVMVTARE